MEKIRLSIIFFQLISVMLLGQPKEDSYSIQISCGYTTFNLSEAKGLISNEINNISRYNIPLELQTDYPGNILWQINLNYHRSKTTRFSLGVDFTQTSAYALYGDYAGEIDFTSELKMYGVFIGLKQYFLRQLLLKPFISVSAGVNKIECSIKEDFIFYNLESVNYQKSENISDIDYKLEFCLGLSYEFNNFDVSLETGYRFFTFEKESISFPEVELDMSGVVYKLSFLVYLSH